ETAVGTSSCPRGKETPEDEEGEEEVEAAEEPAEEELVTHPRCARHGLWWGWATPAPPTPATGTTWARWSSMCWPGTCRGNSPPTKLAPRCWTGAWACGRAVCPVRGSSWPSRGPT